MMIAFGRARQKHVAFGDAARSGEEHFHLDLFVRKLDEAVADRFDGAEHVGLEDRLRVPSSSPVWILEKSSSRLTFWPRAVAFARALVDAVFSDLARVRFGRGRR